MSHDATRELFERLKADTAFRDRVLAVKDPGERSALLRAEGFDCTAEEVAAHAAALDESELQGIVGAGTCWCHGAPSCPGWDV